MARGRWTVESVASQKDKVVLCTGANSGLGWYYTKFMVQKGARVIMACRSIEKGTLAAEEISKELKDVAVEEKGDMIVMKLDLSSLASVRGFSEEVTKRFERIDVLCNNAGVMALETRELSEDGFEMQLASNHLGHFALTGLLLPLIEKSPTGRIVNVSSFYHKKTRAGISFQDINFSGEKVAYERWEAYAQSKLANILFTKELVKRLEKKGSHVMAVAAHPGFSNTPLMKHAANRFLGPLVTSMAARVVGHHPSAGCLPQLRASVDPETKPGDYYGPDGFREMKGYPILVSIDPRGKDEEAMEKLWQLSEEMTKIRYLD